MIKDTLTIILGGGRGTRLWPLTQGRSKPAVPLAGKYRLIDIPISNSLNSELTNIYVLTQFQSASLNRHVGMTYRFDNFSNSFVEILAAEQTDANSEWYQGTADAVRQHWHRFRRGPIKNVVVLSGDQLYRMDYRMMLDLHRKRHCAATVAVQPVTREQAMGFGVLRLNDEGDIVQFVEKPKDPAVLDSLRVEPAFLEQLGFDDPSREYMASMGIYVFDRDFLDETLADPTVVDFGQDVLPRAIGRARVGAYVFADYWEDIGTIKAFYEANLLLTKQIPNFRFYDPTAPIYTRQRNLPSSKIYDGRITDSIISDGCILRRCSISDSIVGIRTRVGEDADISRTIIMGADWYETFEERAENERRGVPDVGIGSRTVIRNAIIDKNSRIGDDVRIVNERGVQREDGEHHVIRDGIVIIRKHGSVPSGTVI